MNNNNKHKARIIQQLKLNGFKPGDLVIFTQQISIWSKLQLRQTEFVELMHELKDEGYCTVEYEGNYENYRLTAKIE